MKNERHKRKNKYTILLVSNVGQGKTKELHALPQLVVLCIASIVAIIGLLFCYIFYQQYKITSRDVKLAIIQNNLNNIVSNNSVLNQEVTELNAQVVSLNTALAFNEEYISSLEESYNDAQNELYAMYDPVGCPITGTATISDETNEVFPEDTIIFEAYKDADVVSAGAGTVTNIDTDDLLGNLIVIDHGNGYSTYYYCVETPIVIVGQKLNKGEVLFHINKTSENVEYRMFYDGDFIDPWDKLEIYG